METKDEIGIDGFKKIFRLADDVQKSIDNYKNKKTIINFKFDNFSKNKVKTNITVIIDNINKYFRLIIIISTSSVLKILFNKFIFSITYFYFLTK